jgi:transmembrane sensor
MSDSGNDDKVSGDNVVSFDERRARLRKKSPESGTEATGDDYRWKEARELAQSRTPTQPSCCAGWGRRIVLGVRSWAALQATLPGRLRMLALIAVILLSYPSKRIPAPSNSIYSTDPMHRQTVLLRDGSTIDLDAGSSLQLILKPTGPAVRVLFGQAMFHIRHDPRRYWVVWAGPNRIDDLGTDFIVHRGIADTQITVLSGRVAVHLPDSAATTFGSDLELAPRSQVNIHESPAGVAVYCEVLTSQQLSELKGWMTGQVSFANESLQELAEDMGRYNGVTFNASDPAIGGLRVSGVVRRTNLASFLDALNDLYGIQAVSTVNRLGEPVITLMAPGWRGDTGGRHQ